MDNFASFSFFCLFDIWNSDEETGLFDPKHQVNVMSWFRSLETLTLFFLQNSRQLKNTLSICWLEWSTNSHICILPSCTQTVSTASELRKPIYWIVAAKAIDYEQMLLMMAGVKWDIREIMSQHNVYVDVLLKVTTNKKSECWCYCSLFLTHYRQKPAKVIKHTKTSHLTITSKFHCLENYLS